MLHNALFNPTVNMNRGTGIRYGVINLNDSLIHSWLCGYIEDEYQAYCPHCERDIDSESVSDGDDCPYCAQEIEELSWSDEPIRRHFKHDSVVGMVDNCMDIFITDSPYYCLRGLCSPCAPNAGHLKTDGNYQTYCLAAECYEVVPFDIYCVKTGELMAKAGSIVVE